MYRMLDADGKVLYVGKARDLKARLNSYFQKRVDAVKTRALVARVAGVQTTVTSDETEALLLEQALIKELRPPYNVLLRDDKSYPYIRISVEQTFPRVGFHRGKRKEGTRYFGPYPSAGSVREALNVVEKVFRLRNCRDSFFRNRTRPCLQYQIKRCTAPCVGLVSEEDYRRQVALAIDFLDGRDAQVTSALEQRMAAAAEALDFERAAELRDQIAAIRLVQQKQYVDTDRGDVDVIAVLARHGLAVVEILVVRQGRVLGHHSHFPRVRADDDEAEILEAFLSQYYLGDSGDLALPAEVIVDRPVESLGALADALRAAKGRKVRFASAVRGERLAWLRMARENAEQTIITQLTSRDNMAQRYAALAELLAMPTPPARIECFDISHTGGEQAVASCVVFGPEGAIKGDYRRFNVAPAQGGDDYAALAEAVTRRYQRVTREGKALPELLLIDGGKGQVKSVMTALESIGLGHMYVLGISKGPSRRAGLEVLHRSDGRELTPPADSPALHLLQQVRDEAHRFAITGHRARRGKARNASVLEEIPGIGPRRRQQLLHHFGGLQQLRNASVESLAGAPGISRGMAESIYAWLHE
ncbi:excinuclease ABC subunit C [Alcanivorax sp. S71-1-4]|nr:excinuclease ABC subunit C [Alcanivorax sp. S71-1-4]